MSLGFVFALLIIAVGVVGIVILLATLTKKGAAAPAGKGALRIAGAIIVAIALIALVVQE